MSYAVPQSPVEVHYEVKKSRFITRATRVKNRQEAMQWLKKAKDDYPDARHHCWAYLLGDPNAASSAAMSDDGEPSGTAGKPILNVLQHKQVGDVMLIVIRYFGGIKLGAGGLVRAYSAAAQLAMTELPIYLHTKQHQLTIKLDFADEQPLRHWLSLHDGEVVEVEYGTQVTLRLRVVEDKLVTLESYLARLGAEVVR